MKRTQGAWTNSKVNCHCYNCKNNKEWDMFALEHGGQNDPVVFNVTRYVEDNGCIMYLSKDW